MSEAWLPQVNVLRDGAWIVMAVLTADVGATCSRCNMTTYRGLPTHNSALNTSSFRTRRSCITLTNKYKWGFLLVREMNNYEFISHRPSEICRPMNSPTMKACIDRKRSHIHSSINICEPFSYHWFVYCRHSGIISCYLWMR